MAFGSFALGFFIQSNEDGKPEVIGTDSDSSEATYGGAEQDLLQSQREESLLTIQELNDPARFESHIARTRALFNRLVSTDANTLRELLNQSLSLQTGSWQEEVQTAIVQRFAAISPIDAMTLVEEF